MGKIKQSLLEDLESDVLYEPVLLTRDENGEPILHFESTSDLKLRITGYPFDWGEKCLLEPMGCREILSSPQWQLLKSGFGMVRPRRDIFSRSGNLKCFFEGKTITIPEFINIEDYRLWALPMDGWTKLSLKKWREKNKGLGYNSYNQLLIFADYGYILIESTEGKRVEISSNGVISNREELRLISNHREKENIYIINAGKKRTLELIGDTL